MSEWTVTIEAFGQIATRRYSAPTYEDAIRQAKRDVGFRADATLVRPMDELIAEAKEAGA